jgi:hypothetical protein
MKELKITKERVCGLKYLRQRENGEILQRKLGGHYANLKNTMAILIIGYWGGMIVKQRKRILFIVTKED